MPYVFVTRNCNLRCSYCLFKKKDAVLDENTFSKFLDFLDNIGMTKSDMRLVYSGGEALLYPKNILRFADIISKRYPKANVTQAVITNLTIFNKEVFFDKRLDFCGSIDGTEESHNIYRSFCDGSHSHNIVLKNLRYLAACKDEISINYTFIPDNIHADFIEFLKEIISINPRIRWKFLIQPAYKTLNVKNYRWLQDEMIKTAEFLISKAKKGNYISVDFFNSAIKGWYNQKNGEINNKCGYAADLILLTPEGGIFPCSRALVNNNPKIGNVNSPNGLVESSQRVMLREVICQLKDNQSIGCGKTGSPISETGKCSCNESQELLELITSKIIELLEKNLNKDELMKLHEKTKSKIKSEHDF